MGVAKVIFTDGFHTGPVIETDSEYLERRIIDTLEKNHQESPGLASTYFVLQCVLTKSCRMPTLYNTPEGRTYGGTRAMLESQEFWPRTGTNELQAGVFLVHVLDNTITYWGGHGFDKGKEFTSGIPQTVTVEELLREG